MLERRQDKDYQKISNKRNSAGASVRYIEFVQKDKEKKISVIRF